MTQLSTARLTLRPVVATDIEALLGHWSLPSVRRWLWDDRVPTTEEVEAIVESSTRSWNESGYGLWCIEPLDRPDMIGVVGFRESSWEAGVRELVYSLDPAWWGKRIATEAAEAAVDWAFATLGWVRIVAATDTPNVGSARVLERIGMRLVREGILEPGLPTLFYEMPNQ